MSSRNWIAIVAILAASMLAIVWLFGSREPRTVAHSPTRSRPSQQSAELANPPARSDQARTAAVAGNASSGSTSGTRQTALPASIDVVALFEGLNLDTDQWIAIRMSYEFRELDLSPLRDLVRAHRLTADRLLDAFESIEGVSELQPAMLLACAYCPEVGGADRNRLLAIGDVEPTPQWLSDAERQHAPYAAIRALWMLGAQDELQQLAQRALPRYLDWDSPTGTQERPMFVRDSAALAMEGLAELEDEALHRQLRRLLESPNKRIVSEAAWRLYARSADHVEQLRILEDAYNKTGLSQRGMMDIADEACVPAIGEVARLAPRTAYGSYLRQSACVSLFNIASPAAWQVAERILLETEPGSDVWNALSGDWADYPPRPQNLANMLECAARWTDSGIHPDARSAMRSSIDRTNAELDRCIVPRRIVKQTCANMRALVPKFSHDAASLEVALHVLVEHGEHGDTEFAREWVPKLPAEARLRIESRLAAAR